MMEQKEIWHLGHKVMRKLPSYYIERMEKAAKDFKLMAPTWYTLIAAYTFRPDPISIERMRVRIPYASPDYYEGQIQDLFGRGFLATSDLGGYSLTDQGIAATRAIMAAAYEGMSEAPVLDNDEMKSLVQALGSLVQVCMIHGPLISKWSLIYSRRLDEASGDAYTAKLDQYLSDLNSYRDDVHLASWSNHDIGSHAWEVLTLIWREGPSTFDEVTESLTRRKWAQEKTEEAIEELRNRNWVEGIDKLLVTKLGQQIRDESESLTDHYFYAPWAAAERKDLETISKLLPRLAAKLEIV
jgi:hypothetical protein